MTETIPDIGAISSSFQQAGREQLIGGDWGVRYYGMTFEEVCSASEAAPERGSGASWS
jgi:hypothetical protein